MAQEESAMRGYTAIGLYCPKNDYNYGGIIRAAHCYGAGLMLLEVPRLRNFATDTTKATRHIPTIVGPILDHRPHDCPMVVIEINDKAVGLPAFQHPQRALYVFGPEDGSVPARIMDRAQYIVSIPTRHCMNLAATVNVVLYDRLAKADRASRLDRAPGARRPKQARLSEVWPKEDYEPAIRDGDWDWATAARATAKAQSNVTEKIIRDMVSKGDLG